MTVEIKNGDISEGEVEKCIEYAKATHPGKEITKIEIEADGDYVNLTYHIAKPFERIRRITGYLVGSLDRFNNAKRKEEADRVKHSTLNN